jgi:hypothetical protein
MYNIDDELITIKDNLTNMFIAFNNIRNSENINNRNSENIEEVRQQLINDKVMFNSLRNNALSIFDICNKLLMKYSVE